MDDLISRQAAIAKLFNELVVLSVERILYL